MRMPSSEDTPHLDGLSGGELPRSNGATNAGTMTTPESHHPAHTQTTEPAAVAAVEAEISQLESKLTSDTSGTSGPNEAPDKQLLEKALRFLSTATPGTLCGIGVGFAALTYMLLGRVGLVLIGAVAGAASFVVFEARNPDVSRVIRGESGVEVLDRVWQDLKTAKPSHEDDADADAKTDQAPIKSFDDFRPETREALGGFVDAVIRDYVKWWYTPIAPLDRSFPLACRKTFTSYMLAISNHMYRKRPADAYLDFLTNSSSIVIVFMSELAAAFSELPQDSNMTAADTVHHYLSTNPDSRLANLVNRQQQTAKFKMVADDLLAFLDQNSYNCDPARAFLREIFASSILDATVQRCSKPEWINGWIVHLLEAGEPDLSQAIDVGMQSGRDTSNAVFADFDGNVGNVSLAKPSRPSADVERGRRKEHKKKLSKADEELEMAMEEMKRMNELIASEDARRKRASTITENPISSKQSFDSTAEGRDKTEQSLGHDPMSPTSATHPDRYSSPGAASTNGVSTRSDIAPTPPTPQPTLDSSSQKSSPRRSESVPFTNFDQIVSQGQGDGTEEEEGVPRKEPLTLHNATFTLHDDTTGDKERVRSKPTWDYLIQVEPKSVGHSGWMIVRRYGDFETLHEILRRIATISGATAFTELHKEMPSWKVHTRESLRGEMERYLRDACWYQALAESEGMKRFLEKSQGHSHSSSKTFGWEAVGKNMLDVLTIAPKGAMEGGRSLVGGVSGVFGNIPGLNRRATNQSVDLSPSPNRLSISTPPRMEPLRSPVRSERASMDSQRSSVISTQPGKVAPMERRTSYQSQCEIEGDKDGGGPPTSASRGRLERTESYFSNAASARPSMEHSRASSLAALRSPSSMSLDQSKLPPPPDEMPDDYGTSAVAMPKEELRASMGEGSSTQLPTQPPTQMHPSRRNGSVPQAPLMPSPSTTSLGGAGAKKISVKQYSQLSESETRVAVELLFAVINEMYTLSSAWNIRRTLLAAAKSFLLRPGNPSLVTVQSLMQSSVLDANTSDAGIAAHLGVLRENTMPTEEELAGWPAELTAEEKEKLAARARTLLISSGVPAALTGVMGQAATGEALGRVFDCLQIEEVARGLLFGLLLQAVRVVTH